MTLKHLKMTIYTEGGIQTIIWRKYLLIVAYVVVMVACDTMKPSKSYIHLEGKAQGTTFSIIYFDSLERRFDKQTDSLLKVIDKSVSLWDSTSIISNFNNNTPNTVADEHFTNIFKRSMEMSKLTEGAFDVTVSPLVKRWGFHYKKNETMPDSIEIKNLLACCGWQKVRLENGILIKQNPCNQVDFNAIAQGYTVDLMAQFLEKQGISSYMIEIGGEVRTLGKNESGEFWHIGIDKPIENTEGRPLQRIVTLDGKSLATSGSYRKFIMREGRKYSHTIDPTTGYPIQHNLLSVSVKANNCADADALATAFMVMGLDKAKVKAAQLGIAALFIFQNEKQVFEEVQVGDF
jgi:FAD:protein FMN transferase